jgi:hypothetical protein
MASSKLFAPLMVGNGEVALSIALMPLLGSVLTTATCPAPHPGHGHTVLQAASGHSRHGPYI